MQRQASELLHYCKQGYAAIGAPVPLVGDAITRMEFANGSRIISVPGKESTIRGFQGVDRLIIDEAARVPDDLYASVSPMTAISGGQQILLSTPFGQRGFFWREWHDETGSWVRFRVPWKWLPALRRHLYRGRATQVRRRLDHPGIRVRLRGALGTGVSRLPRVCLGQLPGRGRRAGEPDVVWWDRLGLQ